MDFVMTRHADLRMDSSGNDVVIDKSLCATVRLLSDDCVSDLIDLDTHAYAAAAATVYWAHSIGP